MKKLLSIFMLFIAVFTLIGCEKNSESTFNIAKHWDKTGIRNHFHAGSSIGPLEWFATEPLIQYVRSTDEIHYMLAEEVKHNDDNTTIIKIRDNAKWQNGDDYLAEDVMAFFHINFVEISNYLTKPLEEVDSKTVKLTWKDQFELNDTIKTYLIAQHKVGTVQYKEFKPYVDRAMEILDSQENIPEGYTGHAPYGKLTNKDNEEDFLANYTLFKAHNPKWFVATGGYKLDKMNQQQMILIKNEHYYFYEELQFDKIIGHNIVDQNAIYRMLQSGELDYQDGLASNSSMLNEILNRNQNMAHIKMFDPGAIGILFNLEKDIWTPKVREAFQYIFNRDEMRKSGNEYGVTSNLPVVGMADSEVKSYLTEEHYNNIPKYNEDHVKATNLLKEAGWVKNGADWTLVNGTKVELELGYDGSHPGMSGVAEATSASLRAFGINVVLKRADSFGTWYDTGKSKDSPYDFVVNWTGLNMTFDYPTGSFSYFYNDINSHLLHIPRYTEEDFQAGLCDKEDIGKINLQYEVEGKEIEVKDILDNLYSYDEVKLEQTLYEMILGAANNHFGVQLYQNVTGSFINYGKLDGVPMIEEIQKNRNVTVVPEVGTEDFYGVARTNLIYSQGIMLNKGFYKPKKDK